MIIAVSINPYSKNYKQWYGNFDNYHDKFFDGVDWRDWVEYLNKLENLPFSVRRFDPNSSSLILEYESEEDMTAFILKWS